ncbi:MAG: hypothetical protein BWY76_00552 [bacterium ADurb.Bin429]|nr:MAG: hypothetical protein BWY76_00552 [bacterium ADurb.Bin429]
MVFQFRDDGIEEVGDIFRVLVVIRGGAAAHRPVAGHQFQQDVEPLITRGVHERARLVHLRRGGRIHAHQQGIEAHGAVDGHLGKVIAAAREGERGGLAVNEQLVAAPRRGEGEGRCQHEQEQDGGAVPHASSSVAGFTSR